MVLCGSSRGAPGAVGVWVSDDPRRRFPSGQFTRGRSAEADGRSNTASKIARSALDCRRSSRFRAAVWPNRRCHRSIAAQRTLRGRPAPLREGGRERERTAESPGPPAGPARSRAQRALSLSQARASRERGTDGERQREVFRVAGCRPPASPARPLADRPSITSRSRANLEPDETRPAVRSRSLGPASPSGAGQSARLVRPAPVSRPGSFVRSRSVGRARTALCVPHWPGPLARSDGRAGGPCGRALRAWGRV